MISFLVIDDDRESSAVIAGQLLERKLEVRVARTDEEALAALAERPADVIIVSMALREGTDRARLDVLRAAAPHVTTVALTASPSAEDRARADGLGVTAVITRGALEAELDAAVAQAVDVASGFRGSLHGLNLHDVLQMFHMNKRTLSVHVGGRGAGRVDFERGEIVHAVRGELTGRTALAAILGSSSGSVRTGPRADDARTLTQDFAGLMLQTMHQMDEVVRSSSSEIPLPVEEEESMESLASRIDRLDALDLGPLQPGHTEPSVVPAPLPSALPTPSALPRGSSTLPRGRDALCRAVLAEVSGAVAVALFVVASGEIVGLELEIPVDRGFERDWVAYFRAIFGGPEVRALAARLDEGPYVEEAQLTTRHGHLLGRALKSGTHALVVMLPKSRDVAAAWVALRPLVRGVETNL